MPVRSHLTDIDDVVEEMPPTMRAARIHGYGGHDVIQVDEVAVPVPGPGEVLIRVAATSFNPVEVALRSGELREVMPLSLPYTLGWDVSGTVVKVGATVTKVGPGDRVIGWIDTGGAAAEYVVAPMSVLAAAPFDVSLEDAAAIPSAALTAWQAVVEHGEVQKRQRVLINGAGGGVGLFAVQFAKRAGAVVLATADPDAAAVVRAVGADQVMDWGSEVLPTEVDVVINLVAIAPSVAAELAALVRPGGRLVSASTPFPGDGAVHFVARNDAAQLAKIVALVNAGRVKVEIAHALPLTELSTVHRRSETGQISGKIIIRL
ncbi:NADP-dependent oxidoreductase [Nocardia tengchongensis]|uniref:NADP-dependent oxidoreductase n=1 Tax=Nocardia tengchongensis TaxID=2055889 RepID=UPI00369F7507